MSRSRVAGLLLLCFLTLPVVVTGQGSGSNPIAGISVTEEANETVVTITASRTPTFSVFKLEDPVRLFVDVNQGDVSKVSDPVLVDNGVLDQVGTLQFRSSGVPVGRIILGMRLDAAYDVRTIDNGIVIRIDAAGRRASTAEAGALATQVTGVREELKREQALLRQLKDARERDQSLREKEEASRMEAERLRAEAQRLQEQAQRDAAQADQAAREASARAAAAERSLQALNAETVRTQARQAQAEKDLKALSERKATESTTESRRLEAQRADATAKIAEAERKLQSLREETAKAEAQRSSLVQAGQVESDRLNALRREQDALRAQTATAEAQRKALDGETARALARREQVEQELKALTERKSTQMSAEAKADVARLQAQRTEADRQAREASAKSVEAERKLAALRDETAKVEAQRSSLAAARQQEVDRLNALRKEQDTLRAQTATAEAQRKTLEDETARALARREQVEQELKSLTERKTTQLSAEAKADVARLEAQRVEADRQARDASAKVAAAEQKLAALRDETTKAEGRQKALEDETAKTESQRATLADARRLEAERLEVLRKEQQALKAGAAALAERNAADEEAARQATIRRVAEEQAADRARLAREAAEAALTAEQDRLAAVRTAREAEEANQKAQKEVAARENENLALARAARQNEEKLQAELKVAKVSKESAAQAKVVELERILAEQREKTTAGAKARDEALRTAQQSAKATGTELATAQAKAKSLEMRLAELQGERETLAKRAKTAEDEARKAATRSEQASATLDRKELARRQADETGAQLKAKREELTRLEARAKSQTADLVAVSSRKEKESADLSAIEAQRLQAAAAYDETARKLADEERRLADITKERALAEQAAAEARQQVMDLQARRQAELSSLRKELATARVQDQGVETTKTEALAREVAARETELAARRAELAELRADVEAARAESASKDATIREMTTEMTRARGEVAKAQETASSKEKEVAGLRAALNAEKAGRADRSEVSRLQTALADKERSLATVRTDLANRLALADDLARRRADEVERLGSELQRLKSERRDGESTEVARMRERLQNREAEMQVLRKAYDEARVAAKKDTKVESRAASLKAKVEQQQDELKALRAEVQKETAGSKAGLRERDARIAELAQQIDALKASGAAKESQEVGRLKDLVARREAELAAARARETESRKTTVATQAQKSEQKRLRGDLEEAQASLDRARADMSGAKAKEREALDREAKAASRIDDLLAAQAKADRDLQGVRAEASELARQLTTREAEVARLQNELDQSRKAPPARTVAQEAPARKAIIRSIDFKSTRTGPTLVLGIEGTPEYDVTPGTNQWVMTIRNATLPKDLERRMDVTAFESRVSMVSAFVAEDGSVRIVAQLAKPVGQQVQVADGRLAWTFAGQSSDQMMAGAATPPATARATPPSKMVARAIPPSSPPAGYTPTFAPATSAPASMAAPSPGTVASGSGDGAREYLKPAMVPKKKKYRGKRINLTVKDADIHNVLTFLAREGKVNVVISEAVQGKVTFHLEDVPWDLALDTVLKTKGLDYVIEQGIYRVAPIDVIQKEYEAQVEKQKKVQELKPIVVRLIPINYGEGSEMLSRVRSVLSPKGAADVDARTNTLIIKDTEEYLEAAEDLVRRLDQQTAQILIEARIVEARTTFSEDIGIQWGGKFAMASAYGNETGLVFPSSVGLQGGAEPASPTGGISVTNPHWAVNLPAAVGQGAGGALGLQLGSIGGAANLTLRLSAAESTGDVKIISSPRISTLDNRRATISQGVSIPISVVSASGVNTQFFSAELRLDVVPHVTRDGHINMKLDISKNEPDFGNVAANGNPTIQKKEARTELLIRDGDTTVIGGIYTRTTSKSYKKIPLLGDIPILGWLFKSRAQQDNRSELLIFITPKVVNREVAL
jgi:type IV pilus assembly protein PilQ